MLTGQLIMTVTVLIGGTADHDSDDRWDVLTGGTADHDSDDRWDR